MERRALIVGALTAALPFMVATVSSDDATWGVLASYLGTVVAVVLFKKPFVSAPLHYGFKVEN
ncbi:hypothetical protein [Glycomyces tenuis]|uniref:hypothetical protein n=1 Tax=Glycomyces tenuis TaxID=58116 RepID=UPI0012DDD356|nr:hypothetical protein [Glycomyces tenuis]